MLKDINKVMNSMQTGSSSLDNDGPTSMIQKMLNFRNNEAGSFDEYLTEQGSKEQGIGGFMTAYRLTGESKVKGVCEFLDTLAENGAKFLVFAHH